MRTLSDTLTAAQKAAIVKPAVRVVLVSGETEHTFYNTSGDHRIVAMEQKEQGFAASATILLDNSDKYFSDLPLKGYKATISWGCVTPAGIEYSATAPLEMEICQLDSSPGRLYCSLYCLGEMSMLAEDKADASFLPTTETPKALIEGTLKGDGVGGLVPFDHCPAYSYEWDTGYDDGLIDSFVPKESVRVSIGTSRLAFIRRVIDFTNDVIRYEDDEKFHILKPVLSGDSYDYEYELDGEHTFFTKTQMERLVIPNLVKVWNDDYTSQETHGKDATSYGLRPVVLPIKLQNLASVAEANNLADAILAKLKMHAKTAEAIVPMNCGQEIWDYIKITDTREGTTQTGNVGAITRHYGHGRYRMTIKLGGWTSMKEFSLRWEIYGGSGDDISYPPVAYPLEVDWMWIKILWFSTLVATAGGPAIDIIRDEDNMVSDDPQALATQQSIKKYVDDRAVTASQAVVTGSRASNTTYTNNTGTTLYVNVRYMKATDDAWWADAYTGPTTANIHVDGKPCSVRYGWSAVTLHFIVPPGYKYQCTTNWLSPILQPDQWVEWTLDVA